MIITIKNLQRETFTVDVDPMKTVLELKKQVYAEQGDAYPVNKQKLIYAGVILDDDKTIESYDIRSNKFLVVMIKRDLGTSTGESYVIGDTVIKSAETTSTADTKVKSEESECTAKSEDSPKKQPTDATASTNAPSTSGTTTTSKDKENKLQKDDISSTSTIHSAGYSGESMLLGEDYDRMVGTMMEMGYSKDMVERALQASFNNAERAVEYLIAGIPENVGGFQSMETAEQITVPEIPDEQDPLDFLRNQPQFVQMRALVNQNPDLLNAVLQQIGQTNPALLRLISENQESFLNMLNEPIDGPNPLDPEFFMSLDERRQRQQPASARSSSGGNIGRSGGGNSGNGIPRGVGSEPDATSAGGNDGRRSANEGENPDTDSSGTNRNRARATDVVANDEAAGDRAAVLEREIFDLNLPPAEAASNDGSVRVRVTGGQNEGSGNVGGRAVEIPPGGGDDLLPIAFTDHDRAAIARLMALGFQEHLVVQAYFACERNETAAANFLLNAGLDD